jgi:hypothetical protein
MVQEREGREGREGNFPLQNPVTVLFRYSRGEESGGLVQEREGREGHFPVQFAVTVSFRYSRGAIRRILVGFGSFIILSALSWGNWVEFGQSFITLFLTFF